MYVIVEIQGQQFKAEKDRFLYVHYLGENVKGDKVIVFKKKRRNDYRRKNGHRQYFTKVVIKDIQA